MVDPITTGGIIIGGYLAKKLFGPSLDIVAETIAAFTELRVSNIRRVIENAKNKSDPSMEEGGIPARVALRVIEEGSYTDDELVIEYLGGVLASSRTPRGRDDRGNTFLAQVSRLSTYHLRAHYIFYSEFRRLMIGRNVDIHDGYKLSKEGMIFVPFPVFATAMDFDENESMFDILVNIFHTLKREALLEYSAAGEPPILQAYTQRTVPAPGIVVSPTISGIELYLWALGAGRSPHNDFLDPGLKCPLLNSVEIHPQSLRVEELPPIGQDQ